MHKADKIGALLREAYESGHGDAAALLEPEFEAWLAENGDEILAAVAELAQGVRAQEAAKVRALAKWDNWIEFRKRHPSDNAAWPRGLAALARDIEDGTL